MMMYVCPHCGWITDGVSHEEIEKRQKQGYLLGYKEICKFCNTDQIETRFSSDEYFKRDIIKKSDLPPIKPIIFDEYLKDNPMYDTELHEQLLEFLENRNRHRSTSSGIMCPYCKSHDTKKISTAGRAVSVGLFGFASKKIGKQWHCNKCGSDF